MYERSSFGPDLTPMVQRIMIINGIVFLLQGIMPGLAALGAISSQTVLAGAIWQPFSYMWLHAGWAHILFNMFALWMFGGTLEHAWGSQRFLNFYLTCGAGAGFLIFFWDLITPGTTFTLGASGAIYGLLTAFSLTWPDRTVMLMIPPMPIKAIWFIPLLFVLSLTMGGGNVSHVGHLGGVIVAGLLMRNQVGRIFNLRSLSYRYERYKMKRRLRTVRREEHERRRRDDDDRPTYH